MAKIRVAVSGAAGKMGREVVRAIAREADLQLVGAVDPRAEGEDAGSLAGLAVLEVACLPSLRDLAGREVEVLVDFTGPSAVKANALMALELGIRPVIGTTGMTLEDLQELDEAARRRSLGALVAPNFAIGALLMMRFAAEAARYFPHAEIIELHHNQKADAPSGTAIKTAELMADVQARFAEGNAPETEKLPGARGAEFAGIRIHSVRLPGLVAHQEVLFGGLGQTLTLRHDSTSRESFMPGVVLAIRKAHELEGLVYGLEHLL